MPVDDDLTGDEAGPRGDPRSSGGFAGGWMAPGLPAGQVWPEQPMPSGPPSGPPSWAARPEPSRAPPYPPSWTTPSPDTGPPRGPKSVGPGPWIALGVAITLLVVVVSLLVVRTGTAAPPEPASSERALPTAPPTSATTSTTADASPSSLEPALGDPTSTSSSTTSTTRPATTTTKAPTPAEMLLEDRTAAQLRTPTKPAGQGDWRALFTSRDGQPVGFNPCKTIHYTVHVGAGPANGLALVQQAVAKVQAATGLTFQYDGPNNVIPQYVAQRGSIADLTTAYRPVFIGWATPNETNIWSHESRDALGVTSPEVISFASGDELIVSGAVVLLPTTAVTAGFGAGASQGNVILHELGHLVGLDHVSDPNEIMIPVLSAAARDGFGPGDLLGLWNLGASRGCASSWLTPDD